VLGLTWAMLRLDVTRVHVRGGELRLPGTVTKNRRPLTLPLADDLLALLDRRWQARVESCPFVFHRGGRHVVRFDIAWREAAAAIGQPGLLFHDLRRSGARVLRRRGVDTQTIMKLGGRKTPSMFTRYAIVDERDLADAQAEINAALATPTARTVMPLRRRAGRSSKQ
jgi:integrase